MGCRCTLILLLCLSAQWLRGCSSKTGTVRLGWPQRCCPASVRLLSRIFCRHRKYSVFYIEGLILQISDYTCQEAGTLVNYRAGQRQTLLC